MPLATTRSGPMRVPGRFRIHDFRAAADDLLELP
jgi:hypothetical protein